MLMKNILKKFSLRLPKEIDLTIHLTVIMLMIFSILMITSASMGHDTGEPLALLVVVVKQLIFMILGYFTLTFVINNFELKWFEKRSFFNIKNIIFIYYLIGILLLMARFLFKPIGGTYGWIYLPIPFIQITLQPSEFAKVFIIIFLAYTSYISNIRPSKAKDSIETSVILAFALFIAILLIQKDLGSAVVFIGISVLSFLLIDNYYARKYQLTFMKFIIAGFILTLIGLSPIGDALLSKINSYKAARFLAASNPFVDRFGSGFQLVTGLISQASGGFFGLGYGNSIRKYSQFPAADTDFILAIIIEELGFFGYLIVLLAYFLIIYRLFRYALLVRSNSHKILLFGTAMYLFIHFVLNVGGVSALIPLTGVPLLLVSSGGSSIIALMIAIGMCQNTIVKYKKGIIQ